jgi:hypothetical protein
MNNNYEKNDLSKCLKSYLTGKKYYDTDINKSISYFKQCIKCLNNIKNSDIPILSNILDETESECIKYITYSIINLIDMPFNNINLKLDINLFNIIETGSINSLKNIKYKELDFKQYYNGLTPLHYAIKYGDTRIIRECLIIGADIDETNINGHTLLEYACLENDPNIINFLILYGADMKKHLEFRENKKYFNIGNEIDILLLKKYIFDKYDDIYTELKYLDWIFEYLNPNEIIDIQYIENINNQKKNIQILSKNVMKEYTNLLTIKNLINYLDKLLDSINNINRENYLLIIKEELQYNLINNLGCPSKKIDILLYNLIPFIDYNNNLKLNWLISLEIKFTILKILNNTSSFYMKDIKEYLKNILYKTYIKNNLINEGYLQILLYQWILKIKV